MSDDEQERCEECRCFYYASELVDSKCYWCLAEEREDLAEQHARESDLYESLQKTGLKKMTGKELEECRGFSVRAVLDMICDYEPDNEDLDRVVLQMFPGLAAYSDSHRHSKKLQARDWLRAWQAVWKTQEE